MIVEGTIQLGNFKDGINIYIPKKKTSGDEISPFALMYNGELITYNFEQLTYGA